MLATTYEKQYLPYAEPPRTLKLSLNIKDALTHLDSLEAIIDGTQMKFVEEGEALRTIRDNALYKVVGFKSFGAYCKDKWGITGNVAGNYIRASRVVKILQEAGYRNLPSSHSLYIAWSSLDEEEVAVLWGEYLDLHPTPDQVSARTFVKEYKQSRIVPKPKTHTSISVPIAAAAVIETVAKEMHLSKAQTIQRMIDKLME